MPHFNDEPCPCGRGQAMAELAAELVKLKAELEKTDLIAMTTFEMAAAVAKLAGIPSATLKAEMAALRRRQEETLAAWLDEPGEPKEGKESNG